MEIIDKVIEENPHIVQQIKSGKEKAINSLIGKISKIDDSLFFNDINAIIREKLDLPKIVKLEKIKKPKVEYLLITPVISLYKDPSGSLCGITKVQIHNIIFEPYNSKDIERAKLKFPSYNLDIDKVVTIYNSYLIRSTF